MRTPPFGVGLLHVFTQILPNEEAIISGCDGTSFHISSAIWASIGYFVVNQRLRQAGFHVVFGRKNGRVGLHVRGQ